MSEVTRQDLLELRAENMSRRMDDLKQSMGMQMFEWEQRMVENMRNVETALLTAFHRCAGPVEMRAGAQTALLRALDIEVAAPGERLKRLEDK